MRNQLMEVNIIKKFINFFFQVSSGRQEEKKV